MRPNKMRIGKFILGDRSISKLHLFEQTFRLRVWTGPWAVTGPFLRTLKLDEVAFVHDCGIRSNTVAGYYINENGYCTQCGKFIATHKKLEVMAGLKELND